MENLLICFFAVDVFMIKNKEMKIKITPISRLLVLIEFDNMIMLEILPFPPKVQNNKKANNGYKNANIKLT